VFDVLFVCTGNICRSPMAELVLAQRLRAELGDGADAFRVHSAGTRGLGGYPIDSNAARAIAHLGIDTDSFRARALSDSMLAESDLILAATREHRAGAARLLPRITGRAFTLREFGRLCEAIDESQLPAGTPVERARAIVAAAAGQRGLQYASPQDDDIADPYGGRQQGFTTSLELIESGLAPMLRLLTAGQGVS
jgi:protein-tyrosine phosphatase